MRLFVSQQDRAHRQQEPQEAIEADNFDSIGVQISCTTFENVMYAAGTSRQAPGVEASSYRSGEGKST